MAKGYNQEEGIDYGETFTPIARLEVVRLLLALACMSGLKLFQKDVKSSFLNGLINEEVYVEQPSGFEDHQHPNHVYKLKKALYGFKQPPRQWYERLNNSLLSNGYERRMIDKTLFIKKSNSEIILVQIYVDDIIFCATKDNLCEEFVAAMQGEFEMSMMGELSFFLGLQVKKSKDGIFLCQSKYCKEILKKFEMESCKEANTPMPSSCYIDADMAGKEVGQTENRGLIGFLLYLTASRPDIMFAVCLCERFQANPSAINLTKNHIQHSRTKHIEIRHHFIRDHVNNGDCEMKFIETRLQLTDIFTKSLQKNMFFFLRNELGILDSQTLS